MWKKRGGVSIIIHLVPTHSLYLQSSIQVITLVTEGVTHAAS